MDLEALLLSCRLAPSPTSINVKKKVEVRNTSAAADAQNIFGRAVRLAFNGHGGKRCRGKRRRFSVG